MIVTALCRIKYESLKLTIPSVTFSDHRPPHSAVRSCIQHDDETSSRRTIPRRILILQRVVEDRAWRNRESDTFRILSHTTNLQATTIKRKDSTRESTYAFGPWIKTFTDGLVRLDGRSVVCRRLLIKTSSSSSPWLRLNKTGKSSPTLYPHFLPRAKAISLQSGCFIWQDDHFSLMV